VKNQRNVTRALAVAVFLLIIAFPGRLFWSAHNKANAQAAAYRAQTAQVDLKISEARQVAANPTATQAKLTALHAALPPNVDYVALLGGIQNVVDTTGVTWQSASPAPAPVGGGASGGVFNVGIGVSGTLAQVQAFVTGLQAQPRLFKVNNLTIAPTKGQNQVSGAIQVSVFYLPSA